MSYRIQHFALDLWALCFDREWKKTQEHSLQSAGPTSSVPPWRGGQRWPQHHRTPRFHVGRAGAHCGEQDSRSTFRNNGLHRAHSGEHILKHLKRQLSQKYFCSFPKWRVDYTRSTGKHALLITSSGWLRVQTDAAQRAYLGLIEDTSCKSGAKFFFFCGLWAPLPWWTGG